MVFLTAETRKSEDVSISQDFYREAWDSDYTHIGTYENPEQSIKDACEQTIVAMTKKLPTIKKSHRVIHIGSVYGGTARFLANKYQCKIDCLNENPRENKINEQKIEAEGLGDLVKIKVGTVESLALDYQTYDMVWAQDFFIGKTTVQIQQAFREIARTLKPEGRFIFTDVMLSDNCPDDVKERLYSQLGIDTALNIAAYKKMVRTTDLQLVFVKRMPEQLEHHYTKMLQLLREKETALEAKTSKAFVKTTITNLEHWLDAAAKGYLTWGILQFQKRNV